MGVDIKARDEPPGWGMIMDAVGIWFIVFASVWTALLLSGMSFLYVKRKMPILRIRGLPLSFAAVVLLHIYWLAVQLGYSYGFMMPEYIEFWIMGLWLPFGIALFHASNSRFLYVAEAQKRFIETGGRRPPTRRGQKKTLLARYRQMDHSKRMLLLVGTGMTFQFLLTVFMFFISRKFHPGFGIHGTGVHGNYAERKAQAQKGWEWWPSVVWQFGWAWVVAPLILWRARDLHDTLGWRTQTIACCLSNLHATPLWLVGLYVPQMAPVNKYWIPPQWLAISIMLLEIFTIFLPCWEVIKHQSLRQETLEAIARWEARNKATASGSLSSGSSMFSWKRSKKAASISTSSGGSILTMDALEHTLTKNPEPLQHFSALRDFSGENIAFLTRVAQWRSEFYPPTKLSEKKKSAVTEVPLRESFECALRIYSDFISARGADFQINLSSHDFKMLETVFEEAARIVYGDVPTPDPATPFETANWRADANSTAPSNGSESAIMPQGPTSDAPEVRYWGEIPESFNETVFNDAETHIKYLVLTNTWPKFVKERRSMDSLDSLESGL